MSSGIEKVKVIIAVDSDDIPIILDIPLEDFDKTLLDSNYIEDEPFTNLSIIPRKVGLYELECDLYWDDGCNAFFERTDGDYEFRIISAKELYTV